MQRRLLCALAAGGAAALSFVGIHAGSAGAAAAITVTPNQNLTSGQTVTVHATGFAPNSQGAIVECNAAACAILGAAADRLRTWTSLSPNGACLREDGSRGVPRIRARLTIPV